MRGVQEMFGFKIGDTVVHWAYGVGKVVAIDDKGLPGQPLFYYVIETGEQTLWIPVDENGGSSLHLQTPSADFGSFITILRTAGDKMPDNSYQRRKELDQRMQKRSLVETCLVIRDLTYRSRSRVLSSSDISVLKHAQSSLLDEWVLSLGAPLEDARTEMEWALRAAPARQNTF
jgi:RNA polymerase-interacting CarD/CdnL/TRCF family regulator